MLFFKALYFSFRCLLELIFFKFLSLDPLPHHSSDIPYFKRKKKKRWRNYIAQKEGEKKKKRTLNFLSISLLLVENRKDFNTRAHMSNKKKRENSCQLHFPILFFTEAYSSRWANLEMTATSTITHPVRR